MRKKLFNLYKWKKKMKREMLSSSNFRMSGIEERLTLSPHVLTDRSRLPFTQEQRKWKTRLELLFLLALVLSFLAMSFFHPYFTVKNRIFLGIERTPQKSVERVAQEYLKSKSFFLFPKNNFFVLNTQTIKEQIEKMFPFQLVLVEKKFPHTLSIIIKEKEPVIIYDNTKEYILLGQAGEKLQILRSVEESEWETPSSVLATSSVSIEAKKIHKPNIATLLVAGEKYPIVIDERISNDKEFPLTSQAISGISKWYESMKSKTQITPTFITILEGGEDGLVWTQQGFGIYIKFSEVDTAFPLFFSLLPQIDQTKISYIDMRYLKRVYWK